MQLSDFTIKGLLRFAEALTVDVSALPSGLVALVGPNGEGKSSALESPLAALYRSFPSRDGKELFDYAHDRDSYVEARFFFDDGSFYRARVNVDGVRRVSEAILEQVHPDGSRTVLNDGKVSSFDAAVARVFPSREVMLASAFAAQNRNGSFITLDRKGRKELFAKLLGLEHYEQMAQTARTAAGLVDTSRGKLIAVREVLARSTGPDLDEQVEARERTLAAETASLEAGRAQLQGEIADAEARMATVADQVAAFAVATQRVEAVEREQAARTAERGRLEDSRRAVDVTLAADRKRLEDAFNRTLLDLDSQTAKSGRMHVDEIAKIEATVKLALADVDERTKNNRQVLADADAIRAAVVRVAKIETSIATARADEQGWREQAGAFETLDRAVLVPALTAAQRAQTDLTRAEHDAALMGAVPCEGAGPYSACQFLANAQTAQNRIPALREQAAEVPILLERRRVKAADQQAAHQQLGIIASTIFALEAERKTLSAKAKIEPSIAAAEARIGELEEKRAEATVTADRARLESEARIAERTQEIAYQRKAGQDRTAEALEDLKVRARGQREGLDEQIGAIATMLQNLTQQAQAARADLAATAAGNQQAAQLQAALGILRARWDASTRDLARLEAGQQECGQQRQDLAARRAELADVDRRLAVLASELVDWQLLAKALGRDGLPVLEIDAAGPTVSTYANDLLASSFGPRFSLELVTQEAKASGKGVKEAFEVKVLDNLRAGAARDIGDLSGGEQVIVEECLKNALALYCNARNTNPIRTCWRDETTGPLDAENAARYVPMLRRLQQIGGYRHILFVSHNPEAAAQADAQIRFADGKAEIVLPPYAA